MKIKKNLSALVIALILVASVSPDAFGQRRHYRRSAHYTNSQKRHVPRPAHANTAPAGATAECRDGTFSFSANHRGTCSHHGGVKRWLR